MKKKKTYIITGIANTLIVAIMVTVFVASNIFSSILTTYLGTFGADPVESQTYSKFKSVEDLNQARKEMGSEIIEEGAVLLKNEENTLPLDKNIKVSVFGQHAHEILASGSGSGSIGNPEKNLKEVLEESGFKVNSTLWDFYLNNGGKSLGNGPALTGGNSKTDWSINECQQSDYTADVKESYNSYNDAAIVVISRTGGEGGDLATDMSAYGGTAEENYLELSKDEKDMLKAVTEKFEKVIVLLNTNNAMELGFLKEYNVDACLYIGGVGMSGLNAVGDLLTGKVNPSGHLVDTYVYDNFSAPATQNFGDYKYANSKYNYVVYAEGIYVGYRYFETRYADVIMGANNVGTYDYDKTVTYPFGYGESYTSFEWKDFKVAYDETKDEFVATLKVTNTGDYSGKDVVQLYYQAPYIYGETKVEKSAIELGGFCKTKLLKPGESEEITITMKKQHLISYDEKNAKTYILDAGDYYFTAAEDAHKAVNNVLAAQGYEVEGSGLVDSYQQKQNDTKTYSKDAYTKTTITNLFDDAEFEGMTTLSRDNWSEVEAGIEYADLKLSIKDLQQAGLKGKEASRNPNLDKAVDSVTVKSGGELQLKSFEETPYESEDWNKLVQQIGKSDLEKLFATAGYATIAIESVGKPRTADMDGPGGISSFVGGASDIKAYGYPTETILACSWNEELANKMGSMVGEDALAGGVSGWYAPGIDTHRSYFGGRNFEYYSEDGLLSGKMGAAVVRGAQGKGLYCYIKHFALNEQDTNRGPELHTWASEQAMREIYLKPFQISVQEGKALALMTSLNCIGTTASVGDYDLITRLLKDEWGFQGMVITDYLGYDEALVEQILFAGGDAVLSTYGMFSNSDDQILTELQRAAKNVMYTVSRSNAMYSVSEDGVNAGIPVYKIIMIVAEVLLGLALIIMNLLVFLPRKKYKTGSCHHEH